MLKFYADYLELMETLHRDFKKALSGLPIEALDWVPGEDMNSLCVLAVHTTGAGRYWVGDVAGGIPSNRNRAAEFEAKGHEEAALTQRFDDLLTFTREMLENFTLEDLHKECFSPIHNKAHTAGHALLHNLEHTSMHVGHAQITRQLWDQGKHG